MDLGLKGKVAVVMASSSGIGKGIATVLVQEGCALGLCARGRTQLDATAVALREASVAPVFTMQADVSDSVSLDKFFKGVFAEYGKIDILVTNAGGPPPGKSLDIGDDQYTAAFNLTLMSVIRSCRHVVPSMAERGWGRIVNVASTSAKCALENMALSNVFRSGVAAFSKTLSMEYANHGIRVHTVMSGPFMTNRVNELGTYAASQKGITFDQWKQAAEAGTPLGRFGNPLEFGALVAFLASEQSDYMTGTCIAIDGGVLKTIT